MNGALLRDLRRPDHYRIDNEFLDDGYAAELGVYVAMAYNVICRYANMTTSTAFPSYKTIREKTGMSERKAKMCIQRLIEYHIISCQRNVGRGNKNEYHLLDRSEWKPLINSAPDAPNTANSACGAQNTTVNSAQDAPKEEINSAPHALKTLLNGAHGDQNNQINGAHGAPEQKILREQKNAAACKNVADTRSDPQDLSNADRNRTDVQPPIPSARSPAGVPFLFSKKQQRKLRALQMQPDENQWSKLQAQADHLRKEAYHEN